MTRKTSLVEAIKILKGEKSEHNVDEIAEKLEEILKDLPLNRWSEDAIFDALDQFVEDNHRNPTATDLQKKGLPPVPSIRLRFNMPITEFLAAYYPREEKGWLAIASKEEWIEKFKAECKRIGHVTSDNYNRLRDKNSPVWQTICNYASVENSWNALMNYCGMPLSDRAKPLKNVKPTDFKVQISWVLK